MYSQEQEDHNTYYDHTFTTDKVVEAVSQDLFHRSKVGVKKYGKTLDQNPLNLKEWLQHAYEECLDQANYLKRAIIELETKEIERQIKVEEQRLKDQGWEDFREAAFDAWKKKEQEKWQKEREESEKPQEEGFYAMDFNSREAY